MSRPAKIPALAALVERLRSDLGSGCFVEADHWDGDLAAIGLESPRSPGVLVYLAMTGEDDLAYVECEVPVRPSETETLYNVTYQEDGLEYEAVREVVGTHLGQAWPCGIDRGR